MAKAAPKETKARPKQPSMVETIATSMAKLQELLPQIEDLKQEGFPYRDAVRARVELHVRECAKLVFGERTPEFQQWKQYRVRAESAAEVAETLTHLRELATQLEHKKLELLGIAPPTPSPQTQPVAAPELPREQSSTLSNDLRPAAVSAPEKTETTTPLIRMPEAPTATAAVPAATPPPAAPAPAAAATTERPPTPEQAASLSIVPSTTTATPMGAPAHSPTQASAPQCSPSPTSPTTDLRPATPIAPDSREQDRAAIIQAEALVAAPRPLVQRTPEPALSSAPVADRMPDSPRAHTDTIAPASTTPMTDPLAADDPTHAIRKVCARFHTIARQLRLRGEYRSTLDVEDDRDVQDLLYALLRYELDEVTPQEWTPSYPSTAQAVTLVFPRHRMAVFAKKTKPGVGPREIAQQMLLDCQEFVHPGNYRAVVCFVYDPEGRIGNPRGLEADLRQVDSALPIETIVYPK